MMATPTYDLIEERVLSGTSASETFGSGGTLTQAYKDLEIEIIGSGTGRQSVALNYNGDSGSNYSWTYMQGDGANVNSGRGSNDTKAVGGDIDTALETVRCRIYSYSNTNVYKTSHASNRIAGWRVMEFVSLWRSTNAITSFTLAPLGGFSFSSGSTFRLWGVKG